MDDYLEIISHDVFRYGGGLNKSAAEVYWWLKQGPLTAKQLRERTGRGRTTVFRCLHRMATVVDSRTGEVLSMVQNENGIWQASPHVDLNHIALILGTAGIGKRKREQFNKEQLKHRNELQSGRNQEKA